VPAKARTPLRSIPDLAEIERLPTLSDAVHTINGTVIGDVERIVLEHVLRFGAMILMLVPARNRIEFHIVKFTSSLDHDEFLQRVECVNNIWLEANQCLTARVITMRTIFYL